MAGAGGPEMKNGIMVHYYVANESMNDKAFYNADGEMLIGIHVLSPLLPLTLSSTSTRSP